MRPVLQVFTPASLPERPAPFQAFDRLAAAELGDELPPETYAAIQAALWTHPFSRTALEAWLLEVDGQPVAMFEAFRVTARRRLAPDAPVEHLPAMVLGSGFVPRGLRRAGYGRTLADGVCDHHVARGVALAYGLVEASLNVYGHAHQTRPVVERWFPAAPDAAADSPAEGVEPLFDLAGWTPPPLLGPVDVLLTAEMLDWRLERVALERPQDRARPIGARLGADFVVWSTEADDDALEILHLRADDARVPALIAAACREAAARGLQAAKIWESTRLDTCLPPGARRTLDAVFAVGRYLPGIDAEGWLDLQIGHIF